MKLKNMIKLYVVSLMMTTLGLSQTHITGGYISGVWTRDGSPFHIEGNCVVHQDSSLVVEHGVQVIFNPGCRFRVEGQLLAIGTVIDTITFTASDTIQGMESIDFLNTDLSPQDSSKLVYCKISYGVGSPYPDPYMHGGGLYIKNSSRIRISHCLIAHCRTQDKIGLDGPNCCNNGESVSTGNGGAIYCENSSPAILYNTICFNHTGNAHGGNGAEGNMDFSVGGAAYGGNGGTGGTANAGKGGAIYLYNSEAIVQGNAIFENFTGNAFAGDGGDGGDAAAIEEGWAYGGDGGYGGAAYAGVGGAIATDSSQAIISNNLIYLNATGNGSGGDGGDFGSASGWYTNPGAAGVGGDAYGGSGYALYSSANSLDIINNCIFTRHESLSFGNGGQGGVGYGSQPGQGYNASCVIYGRSPIISNSIIWDNEDPEISSSATVNYSCVEQYHTGIGNIVSDPLFVNPTSASYFLSQIAAGQSVQSPCVDAGNPASPMITGTTRTDGVQDEGVVDMGFHYADFSSQSSLFISPANLEFYAALNGQTPQMLNLLISNSSIGAFNYEISENASWLSVSQTSGGPLAQWNIDTISVSIDVSGLALGTYTGEIVVTASGAQNSPDTIPVSLEVGQPILLVNPDSIVFYASTGGTNPMYQTFFITNAGTGGFQYSIIDSASWLSVSPMTGGPLPPQISVSEIVSVNHAGLSAGTYYANIYVLAPDVPNSPGIVTVIFHVNESLSGPLSGTIASGTYHIISDISVQPGDSLVIEPGTAFIFDGAFKFDINGYLKAIGTESDSIRFVNNNSLRTHWHGIAFNESASDSSILKYCVVAGSDSSGMRIWSAKPTIENCYITGNSSRLGGGICVSGNPTILNCTIEGNIAFAGGGIYIDSYGWVFIRGCTVTENSAIDCGGGIRLLGGYLHAIGCEISNNSSEGPGGGIAKWGLAVFDSCTISSNTSNDSGGGIYTGQADLDIYHSVISDNIGHSGSAIYGSGECNFHITNCTITDSSGASTSSVIYVVWANYIGLFNSIVESSAESGAVFIGSPTWLPAVNIRYNDFDNGVYPVFSGEMPPGLGQIDTINANGDSCDVCYNIYMDPLFVDPANYDFHLQAGSPCIDAGNPVSVHDPDGTIADMGAFYFDQSAGISELNAGIPKVFFLQNNFPNPFRTHTKICYGLPKACRVKLSVYDITGRLVIRLVNAQQEPGVYQIPLMSTEFASGVYIYRLETDEFTATRKMVVLR